MRIKVSSDLIKVLVENKCRLLNFNKRNLAKIYNISYSTLKRWMRSENTIPKEVFDNLLRSYHCKRDIQKEVKVLEDSWYQSKGGKKSVEVRIKRWGKEGFLKQLEEARSRRKRNPLVLWYEKCKADPKVYEKLRRVKQEHVLKVLSSKKCRDKAIKSLVAKYGKDYFKLLGTLGAKNSPLANREKEVVKENLAANLSFNVHVPLNGFCVDFLYDNGFVEEVVGFRKSKAMLFYEIARIYEKSKKINKKFIVTSWFVKKYPHKKEYFPVESFLWLLEKKHIPILIDIPQLKKLRTQIIQRKIGNMKNFLRKIYTQLVRKHSFRGALIEKNKKMNKLERIVEKILKESGFNPKGKTILKTKYGTYIVTDNFFDSTAVFVSKRSLQNLIGYGFIVKNLVSSRMKVIGIIDDKIKVNGLNRILVKKYIDKLFITIKSFEKWAGGAKVAHSLG